MPGFNPLSFSSISTISPENSCPGTLGYDAYAKVPLYVPRSLPQIPPYKIFKSTSPGLRIGFSCSLITTFPGSSIKIVSLPPLFVVFYVVLFVVYNIAFAIFFVKIYLFFHFFLSIMLKFPFGFFINNNNKLSPFYFMYL